MMDHVRSGIAEALMSLQQRMKGFLSCDPSGMVSKVSSSLTFGLKGQESNHDY